MRKTRHISLVVISMLCIASLALTSCSNKSYPCPGNGLAKSGDFSPFDENGNPKSTRGKKSDNGVQTKKQPKKLRRRTNLRPE